MSDSTKPGNSPSDDIFEIDADKLKRMLMLHVRFILFDLRSPESYAQGHIQTALNLPASEFLEKLPQMVPQKDIPIVIYDGDGSSSIALADSATKSGYLNIVNLEGGYRAYIS
jgi:rhodanese-related sulfurtransferase